MDSSFEMLNRTSYFPIYPYPLSEVSSFNSISFQPDHYITTNDYSSYYPHNPSSVYTTNSTSHSPINHSNTIDVHQSNNSNSSSCSLISRSDRCRICSDRASGIHFGVSTCEACKAFFRRTNLSSYSIPLPCSPIRCEINMKNRNNCPSCRFDKCKRLGMDRENVIYGKPSKQQVYHQDYFLEQLTKISNQLIEIFQSIHPGSFNSLETKQQINTFGQVACQLFYQQTSEIDFNSSEIIERIFLFISKSNFHFDHCLLQNVNLQTILSLWLLIYYYETFVFKQNLSQEKLTILIQLLDMQWTKINENRNEHKLFRIDFINTFTKLSDLLLQQIQLDN